VVPSLEERKVPSPEDEVRFWSLLEAAWAVFGPAVREARQELVTRRAGTRADTSALQEALPVFLDTLAVRCRHLTSAELTSLDRVAERKLWEIDRADVYAVIGGSQDGFLYARGFIVAMGREFYDAVADDPEMGPPAVECEEVCHFFPAAECEEICYFFAHLHNDRFERYPQTGSGISRESGENMVGWIA
jgi:hypothetical protein